MIATTPQYPNGAGFCVVVLRRLMRTTAQLPHRGDTVRYAHHQFPRSKRRWPHQRISQQISPRGCAIGFLFPFHIWKATRLPIRKIGKYYSKAASNSVTHIKRDTPRLIALTPRRQIYSLRNRRRNRPCRHRTINGRLGKFTVATV